MELRQLRYFVRVVELGSISRAALDLALVQSALSQQITRLEGELCTRLLQRSRNESGKQRVRIERAALQFRMKLYADEPGMLRPFNDFRQQAIG